MYIINIKVKNTVSPEQHESLFNQHVEWFKKHFQAGHFLMLGPYKNEENAGVIFADVESREKLTEILNEDCYYPDLADYEIREFEAKLVAADFNQKAK